MPAAHPRHVDRRPHDGLQHVDRGGARAGLIAGRDHVQVPAVLRAEGLGPGRLGQWRRPPTDKGAAFDTEITINGADIAPMVTSGAPARRTFLPITDVVPDPANAPDENVARCAAGSLDIRAWPPGTRLVDVPIDRVFIAVHQRPHRDQAAAEASPAAGKVAPASRRWSCRARAW